MLVRPSQERINPRLARLLDSHHLISEYLFQGCWWWSAVGVCVSCSVSFYFGMAKYKGTSRKAVKQLEGVLPLAPSMVCLRKKKKVTECGRENSGKVLLLHCRR